jgi:hypothetical protein
MTILMFIAQVRELHSMKSRSKKRKRSRTSLEVLPDITSNGGEDHVLRISGKGTPLLHLCTCFL